MTTDTPTVIFESERLAFHDWSSPAHIEGMIAINASEEVMKFFPSTQSREQTLEFVERNQNSFLEKGYCYFACTEKATGTFIGFVGLMDQEFESEFTPETDIGWRLGLEHWGKGYATEAALRCLHYAFDELGFRRIIAMAPKANKPSIAVMERLKMFYIGEFVHPKLEQSEHLRDCVCYQMMNHDL